MSDLQALFKQIDQLTWDEFVQVRKYMDQLVRPPLDEDPETRIKALNEAFAAIREGMTQDELDELIEAMNYKDAASPDEYDWLDEPAEDAE